MISIPLKKIIHQKSAIISAPVFRVRVLETNASNKTKEIFTVTNTSLVVHYEKGTDHQAISHVACRL